MKTIIKLTFLIFFISLYNITQAQVKDIEDLYLAFDNPYDYTNVYFKDINNFYNTFEGTWVATQGNKTLKIVLKKLEKEQNKIPYFYDDMDGEYQYIENGVEKINTLNNTDYYKTSIYSASLLQSHHKPPCNTCNPNNRRLMVLFKDRDRDLSGTLYLQHITVNGQPALKGLLYGNGGSYNLSNPPQYLTITVPTGWWTFIKQ